MKNDAPLALRGPLPWRQTIWKKKRDWSIPTHLSGILWIFDIRKLRREWKAKSAIGAWKRRRSRVNLTPSFRSFRVRKCMGSQVNSSWVYMDPPTSHSQFVRRATISLESLNARARSMDLRRLRFLSPVVRRHDDALVWEGPQDQSIIAALLR